LCDPAFLRRVEAELAVHLGPIARHLVKQAAVQATSNQALLSALATELANDAERQQFLLRCRGLS
jgi:serine/threonine-protein kinase